MLQTKSGVHVGKIYRHFKGGLYLVLSIAKHSETKEEYVVYKPLYDSEVSLWVRPLTEFVQEVEHGEKRVPRFAIEEQTTLQLGDHRSAEETNHRVKPGNLFLRRVVKRR